MRQSFERCGVDGRNALYAGADLLGKGDDHREKSCRCNSDNTQQESQLRVGRRPNTVCCKEISSGAVRGHRVVVVNRNWLPVGRVGTSDTSSDLKAGVPLSLEPGGVVDAWPGPALRSPLSIC